MFGFTVYDSITQADATGRIPFPGPRERIEGGHAIVAVGYDDKMKIENKGVAGARGAGTGGAGTGGAGGAKGARGTGKAATTGAFLIRNSWSEGWGENGYGWLPYEYMTRGLAEDFWSVLKKEWIDTGEFVEYGTARSRLPNNTCGFQCYQFTANRGAVSCDQQVYQRMSLGTRMHLFIDCLRSIRYRYE